jgi:hypothetical protein
VLACFPDNALAEMVTQTIRGTDKPAQSPVMFNLPLSFIIRGFASLTVLDMADRRACPHEWLQMCNALTAARLLQNLSLPNLTIQNGHVKRPGEMSPALLLHCLERLERVLNTCGVELSTFRLAFNPDPYILDCSACQDFWNGMRHDGMKITNMPDDVPSNSILHCIARLLMKPRMSTLRNLSLGVGYIISDSAYEASSRALSRLFSALGELSRLQVLRFQGWRHVMRHGTREASACILQVWKLHKLYELTELATDDYPTINAGQADKSIFPSEIPFRHIQYV